MVAGHRHGQRGFDGNRDNGDGGGRTILSPDEPRVGEVGCGRHYSGTAMRSGSEVCFSSIEQWIGGVHSVNFRHLLDRSSATGDVICMVEGAVGINRTLFGA